ncbi:MAG: C4-type zinc ribbon domain-containing protein [Candidatus Kapaibacterium sp.]|nr:hypothetical protein [Bacteroidota bacterium]
METDIQRIAALAHIDEKLDEMHEELGDLPKEVKKLEAAVRERMRLVEQTETSLQEIASHKSNTHITFQEFTDKEAKLADTQFTGKVRNNKEFDAITKEIEFIRSERVRLEQELAQNALKQENLENLLGTQQSDLKDFQEKLAQKEKELEDLSNEQNDEFKTLQKKRKELSAAVNNDWYLEYERIRTFHNDAAVHIRKGSCSGCFSAITPQKLVEMRNNINAYYTCQSCGRILYPEDLRVEEEYM